jgi:hypothetical protein
MLMLKIKKNYLNIFSNKKYFKKQSILHSQVSFKSFILKPRIKASNLLHNRQCLSVSKNNIIHSDRFYKHQDFRQGKKY